jgi:hypothetical protein
MKDFMFANLKQLYFCTVFALILSVMAETGVFAQATSSDVVGNDDSLLDLLFTIKDIKVDEVARTASLARANAIKKAEEEAFDKLIIKLTQQSDRAKLPEISHGDKQALMRGIEIVSEQSSSRRYIATYNVAFEASYVSDFFAQYKIPHVLSPGKGLMVVHGHERGLSTYLWEFDPDITEARGSVDWINRIRSYQFPEGRIFDRLNVTIDTVRNFDLETTLALAEKYDQASALIIHSKVRTNNEHGKELVYRYYLTDGAQEAEGIIFADMGESEGVLGEAELSEVAMLSAMYKEILETIDSRWREQLLVDTSTGGVIEAYMPTLDALQFSDVEARLADLSLIKHHSILSIELPLSKVRFEYSGREDQLILALNYGGLKLEPYGDGWLLRRNEDNVEYEEQQRPQTPEALGSVAKIENDNDNSDIDIVN